MDDKPTFHCGADNCCEGAEYPECQETVGHVFIDVLPDMGRSDESKAP